MQPERPVICGCPGAPTKTGDKRSLRLDLHGSDPNVKFKISDIGLALFKNLPDECLDLLDIAAYVYAADQAVTRGGPP